MKQQILGALAGLALGVALVLVIGFLAGGAEDAEDAANLGETNRETLQLIRDCTIEPAGKCKQLQAEQFRAFARMIALGNSCSDKPGTQTTAQIERCIMEGMTK